MKTTGLLATVLCLALSAVSVAAEGALTSETLDGFRASHVRSDHQRAVYNALSSNDINKLSLNREMVNEHNTLFSHKIDTKGITNQKSSGRCWPFAGLNILRP